MQKKQYIPNEKRAVCSANIATVYHGKRIVRFYNSGEPLVGEVPSYNAPMRNGIVRVKEGRS